MKKFVNISEYTWEYQEEYNKWLTNTFFKTENDLQIDKFFVQNLYPSTYSYYDSVTNKEIFIKYNNSNYYKYRSELLFERTFTKVKNYHFVGFGMYFTRNLELIILKVINSKGETKFLVDPSSTYAESIIKGFKTYINKNGYKSRKDVIVTDLSKCFKYVMEVTFNDIDPDTCAKKGNAILETLKKTEYKSTDHIIVEPNTQVVSEVVITEEDYIEEDDGSIF